MALPIIVYGLLTDPLGRPVAVDVYPGNTADSTTVPDQSVKIRDKFGLTRVVLVGDRGMLTQTQIETLRTYPGDRQGPAETRSLRAGRVGGDHLAGLPR